MFFLLFLLDDRRIRSRIRISELCLMDPDPGGPKHMDPPDPDPQHCSLGKELLDHAHYLTGTDVTSCNINCEVLPNTPFKCFFRPCY
jgi:hypothetical protein